MLILFNSNDNILNLWKTNEQTKVFRTLKKKTKKNVKHCQYQFFISNGKWKCVCISSYRNIILSTPLLLSSCILYLYPTQVFFLLNQISCTNMLMLFLLIHPYIFFWLVSKYTNIFPRPSCWWNHCWRRLNTKMKFIYFVSKCKWQFLGLFSNFSTWRRQHW